jgi:hypothetical protein
LALNIFATNQEQERPSDRFRIVRLPQPFRPPEVEVPLHQPLAPEERKVEVHPFDYTAKLVKFRDLRDLQYEKASLEFIDRFPRKALRPANNYLGPVVAADGADLKTATTARQAKLCQLFALLVEAERDAPRPFIQQLILIANWGMNSDSSHQMYDLTELTQADLDLLLQLSEPSWSSPPRSYNQSEIANLFSDRIMQGRLRDFERDLQKLDGIPYWNPKAITTSSLKPYDPLLFAKVGHEPAERYSNEIPEESKIWTSDDIRQSISTMRTAADKKYIPTMSHVTSYLKALQGVGSIQ